MCLIFNPFVVGVVPQADFNLYEIFAEDFSLSVLALSLAIELPFMFVRWKQKKERVLLDADWLLGESLGAVTSPLVDSKPNGGLLSTLVFCCLIVAAVCLWPVASKTWLRWEWSKQLSLQPTKSAEDVLPILLALNDLSPDNSIAIVSQLASKDAEKRLVAYHLLKKRVERWETETQPKESELAALTNTLDSMPESTHDALLLRAQLASRMLRCVGPNINNASKLRGSLERMSLLEPKQNEPSVQISIAANSKPTPLLSQAVALPQVAPTSQIVALPPIATSPIPVSPPQAASIALVPQMNVPVLPKAQEASVPIAPWFAAKQGGPSNAMNVSSPIIQRSPETNATALSWEGTSVPPPLLETSQKTENSSMAVPDIEPTVAIQGIEQRPIEDILRLLSSTQPKIASSASNELLRRGMTRQQLEIAVALAQGDIQARSDAMDQLVRDNSFDSVPWLAWMAEQADPKVRRKAIAMLGSTSSPEAMRKLRLLKLRESDSSIADQINQALLATGNASSTFR